MHFGVREHAMGAICNGLAAHGGFAIALAEARLSGDPSGQVCPKD